MAEALYIKATLKCPHCEQSFNVKHPMKACTATVTCPKCQQQFNAKFDAVPPEVLQRLQQQAPKPQAGQGTAPIPPGAQRPQQPAQEESSETRAIHLGGSSNSGPIAQLVEKGGIFSRSVKHTLRLGENTIGRADKDQPSDIELKDNAVSRRSATLVVSKDASGYLYRFAINKATNPVYVNGKLTQEGEAIFLKTGDTIQLGKSKLKLE